MFATPLNAYLARALDASPRARELCTALHGRRARIEIEGLPGALMLEATGESLRATPTTSDDPGDLTVHTSALGLLALARGEGNEAGLQGSITLSGDESLSEPFQELARLLRPDLEYVLGKVTGRVPAHLARRAFEGATLWARAAGTSVLRNAADYLAHESRDLVPRAEAEHFFAGIAELRAQLARTEARVAQLSERLAAPRP